MTFKIKRIYEQPASDDGMRVLVDRLWPRGVSKERAALDEWLKEVAPSPELRKWFDHVPERFKDFSDKYIEELKNDTEKKQSVAHLLDLGKKHTVTLLYGAKDHHVNQAFVLKDYLDTIEKSANI